MKKILLLLLAAVGLDAAAQEHFISVIEERTIPARAQFDSLIVEFGDGFDASKYETAFNMAGKLGKDVHFVSLLYNTVDPKGQPIVASGMVAYPEKGRFLGTIEVSPICKEKYMCGTERLFTIECLPSIRGYVVIVPDTIGYGATKDEAIPLLQSENIARVGVDMRLAVQEYLTSVGETRKLPRRSIIFGYSLGAAGALELASYYHTHKDLGVKIKYMALSSGAYDPYLAIGSTIQKGRNEYLVYPAIALGMNRWMGMDMDYSKIFQGKVLEDFDKITEGNDNLGHLARDVYGTDVRGYLHPDFFTEEQNEDVRKLYDGLKSLKVSAGKGRLPYHVRISLRHSVEDTYVPIECTDQLYKELRKAGYHHIVYHRDKHGTHYDEAAKSFVDLFCLIIF